MDYDGLARQVEKSQVWRHYRSGAGGSWMTTPESRSETCPQAGETAWPSVPSYTDTGLTSSTSTASIPGTGEGKTFIERS